MVCILCFLRSFTLHLLINVDTSASSILFMVLEDCMSCRFLIRPFVSRESLLVFCMAARPLLLLRTLWWYCSDYHSLPESEEFILNYGAIFVETSLRSLLLWTRWWVFCLLVFCVTFVGLGCFEIFPFYVTKCHFIDHLHIVGEAGMCAQYEVYLF